MLDQNTNGCGDFYTIRVKGILGAKWEKWFDGMSIRYENSDTILSGYLPDIAALYGLIEKLRNLGLTLLFLSRSRPSDS